MNIKIGQVLNEREYITVKFPVVGSMSSKL